MGEEYDRFCGYTNLMRGVEFGEWQDIETAPKDGGDHFHGQRILATDGAKVAGTYWHKNHKEWRDESEASDDGYGVPNHDNWEPIAWMPLPAPPRDTPPARNE